MYKNSLIGSEITKQLSIKLRTNRVYNAGLIVFVKNGEQKAECYFCGYIDGQIHLDVNEKGVSKSILIQGSTTVVEMANCAIKLVVEASGPNFIQVSARIVKIDTNSDFNQNGGEE
ncbi:hypothetical protein [Ruminiclostridium cellobioparum]|uniref:hypothetical protein n=1 Tax=Ruminiclostridium cellobioparum TaxID=29355 RepID=UPI0028A9C1D3|nr:hypothetical protein [Ruminiclostridium cellobioparum]